MTQRILPILLSLPHGGFGVPDELVERLAITQTDIYNECDLWIDELFDFASMPEPPGVDVLARVSMPIARALIDVNREPGDLDNPDGPVKAHSSYGRTTCTTPLSRDEKQALVQRYWGPFHASLAEAIAAHADDAQLFLDCHNMAQTGPAAYGDPGASRPLICLGNMGRPDGSARASSPTSCSAAYIRRAAALAEEVFAGVELLEPLPGPPPPTVAINKPYPGGYILRQYAAQREQRPLPPGMMIEFNRGLYVGNQNAQSDIAPPNEERIALLRERTYVWLSRLVAQG